MRNKLGLCLVRILGAAVRIAGAGSSLVMVRGLVAQR